MVELYAPEQVSKELGLSKSMLRRYCQVYESMYTPLPRDARNGRLFEAAVLEHFEVARDLVKTGETLEDAFRTLSGSVELVESEASVQATGEEALELLRSMAEEIKHLRIEVQELRDHQRQELSNPEVESLFKRLWKAFFP